MKIKLLLATALAALLGAACNLPGAGSPTAPPTPTVEPTAEPTAEPSATPSSTPTATSTATPSATPAPTVTPTPTEEGPERIRFEEGGTSALVDGVVRPGEDDEYVIYALAEQEMTVELTAAGPSLYLEIISPEGGVLLPASDRAATWSGTLPASGDYQVRVISGAEADTPYVLAFVIPPLEPGVTELCPFTVERALTAYRWASTASDEFGTAEAGLHLVGQYETADGWLGFDPAIAQAPNFGVDRMRWVQPGAGDVSFDPPCPGLRVVLSLEQLRNASYRALDLGPFTLEGGEYRETSDGGVRQVTTIRDDVMSYADLDGDGDEDSLVILATNTGGSGTFVELVAVRNDGGDPAYLAKVLLGDRVLIHHMTVIDGVITIQATLHDDEDPLCCPSLDATLEYRFEDGEFVAVKE